jgi:hypothetical protein
MRKMNGRQKNFWLRKMGSDAYNAGYTVVTACLIKGPARGRLHRYGS